MLSQINKHRIRAQNAKKNDSPYSNKFGCDRENTWSKTPEKCRVEHFPLVVCQKSHTQTSKLPTRRLTKPKKIQYLFINQQKYLREKDRYSRLYLTFHTHLIKKKKHFTIYYNQNKIKPRWKQRSFITLPYGFYYQFSLFTFEASQGSFVNVYPSVSL